MVQTASNVSPAQFWGKKFINSTSRKYVILVAYTENVEHIENSMVYFTDECGKALTQTGMRWGLFWVSHVPSMLEGINFNK